MIWIELKNEAFHPRTKGKIASFLAANGYAATEFRNDKNVVTGWSVNRRTQKIEFEIRAFLDTLRHGNMVEVLLEAVPVKGVIAKPMTRAQKKTHKSWKGLMKAI